MPPRRRRPVQPATRVRLPRAARTRSTPQTEPSAGPSENGGAPPEIADEQAVSEAQTTDEQRFALADAADELTVSPAQTTDEQALAPAEESADADGQVAASEPDAEPATGAEQEAGGAVRARRMSVPVVAAALGVVAVILGGLATWFGLEAGSVGSGVDTQNIALINPAATRQVNQQVDGAVNTIFSYNYADTTKTSQAAQSVLTGKAIQQYNTLFKLVAQDAPQEKLVLATTVTNSGVEMLVGNRARLLIFINQSDTSNSAHKTTAAGAMFAVNAVRQGGRWKIDNIDDFSGT